MSNKNTNPKAKEPIKMRFKNLSNGSKSIFLARWNKDTGKWEYEFLKELYIVPERTVADKAANAETMRVANAVKAQRIVEMQNAAHGFSLVAGRSKTNVIDYIRDIAEKKRIAAGGGKRTRGEAYLNTANQIEEYSGKNTTFRQIDQKYCAGFIEHLKKMKNKKTGLPLHANTVVDYMLDFETVINFAIADALMDINPCKNIKREDKPKSIKSEIVYLTIEEVKALEKTDGINPATKQGFLFSCFTGLRISDVRALTWDRLQKGNDGEMFISYVQKKTKKQEYLPIPKVAKKYLPERGDDAKGTDKVFDLRSNTTLNGDLKVWAALAGVKKRLSLHVSRHSFATILLSLGERIEVVSTLLGHSDIKITLQHYAAIENQLKRDAVSRFDKLEGFAE